MIAEPSLSTVDTYSASIRAFTPVATPTDIVTIAADATKAIKILRIEIFGLQTTAGLNEFFLIKRSTVNTGGTAAAITATPLDSRSPASVAVVKKWTANPTLGTAVGTLATAQAVSLAATGLTTPAFVFDAAAIGGSPIVLRAITEQLSLNFNGAAVPIGMALNINLYWAELPLAA